MYNFNLSVAISMLEQFFFALDKEDVIGKCIRLKIMNSTYYIRVKWKMEKTIILSLVG